MPCSADNEVFEITQSILSQHIAFVARDQPPNGTFTRINIKVILPKIDHHFLELFFRINGTQNAIAVFDFDPSTPQKSTLLGMIPVGWFPGAIVVSDARKELIVANIKGLPAVPLEWWQRYKAGLTPKPALTTAANDEPGHTLRLDRLPQGRRRHGPHA